MRTHGMRPPYPGATTDASASGAPAYVVGFQPPVILPPAPHDYDYDASLPEPAPDARVGGPAGEEVDGGEGTRRPSRQFKVRWMPPSVTGAHAQGDADADAERRSRAPHAPFALSGPDSAAEGTSATSMDTGHSALHRPPADHTHGVFDHPPLSGAGVRGLEDVVGHGGGTRDAYMGAPHHSSQV